METITTKHAQVCNDEARIIVHNQDLWQQYLVQANENFLARQREFPEATRYILEFVDGFDERYGSSFSDTRPYTSDKLLRNDIYIFKDGQMVAQYVDFIASYHNLATQENLTCISLVPEKYALK